LHVREHGYTEVFPPFIVNEQSMFGTGQFPKFRDDQFKLDGLDLHLIPTAEVPVTNLHRDEIFPGSRLPVSYVAYSACFRKEAGAAGKDTRGLLRVHQFNKVELVRFTEPEKSYEDLEPHVPRGEGAQQLGLPGVRCARGPQVAAKTMIWKSGSRPAGLPEVSSCSNFEDFQARRTSIRYRADEKAKPRFVHTLNGSGLAVGRTLAAILENNQQPDGSVRVPEALVAAVGVEWLRPDRA
jgi:seryl-tRNA synthetase